MQQAQGNRAWDVLYSIALWLVACLHWLRSLLRIRRGVDYHRVPVADVQETHRRGVDYHRLPVADIQETHDSSESEADDESSEEDGSQEVRVVMDGVVVDVLRVFTAECGSVDALLREICASAWDLTGGAGPESIRLEYWDAPSGRRVAVTGDEQLEAARAVVTLSATFANRKQAANRFREAAQREAEAARGVDDRSRQEARTAHLPPLPRPPTPPPPPGGGRRALEVERALLCGEFDLWGALGLERGAGADEVRRAYLRCGRAAHPDKNPGDVTAATAAQQIINDAHTILSDPELLVVHERRLVLLRQDLWRSSSKASKKTGKKQR